MLELSIKKFIRRAAQANFTGVSDNLRIPTIDALVRAGFTPNGGSSFVMTDINNLEIWLDAADTSTITTGIGDAVIGWADKSPKENDASQFLIVAQPLTNQTTINGNNVITHDRDWMIIPFAPGLNPTNVSFICVARFTNLTVNALITNFPGPSFNSGGFNFSSLATNFLGIVSDEAGAQFEAVLSTVLPAINTPYILGLQHTSVPPLTRLFIDGVFDASVNNFPISYLSTRGVNTADFFLATPGNEMVGDIGEIIFVSRNLSLSEIAIIDKDLKAKWGI